MAGKSNPKIDTAVIAAAGFGTRLLPLTLHQPKAMVPVAERPLIHYIVDQIAKGGIKRFIVVINPEFQAVREYVDRQLSGEWRNYKFIIAEKRSRGFADSVLAAERFIGKNCFIAASCDDLIDDKTPPFLSLVKTFNRYRRPMAILREVSRKETSNYGIVSGIKLAKDIWRISDIVEKPSLIKARTNLGSIADYILPPEIFRSIRLIKKSLPKEKEPTVVHALKQYLAGGGKLLGWVYRGHHFDGGSKIGLLKAASYFGAKHIKS